MSEKLIVKNFGPIKHVELEIKKINVLIGEQGTGKSALLRLLNHFTNKNFLFGNSLYREGDFEDTFFFSENLEIDYVSDDFQITYGFKNRFRVNYTGKNKNQLERLSAIYKKFIEDHDMKYQDEYYSLSSWYNENIISDAYVPAERIAITTMDKLNSGSRDYIDQYIVKFFLNFHNAREKKTEFDIPHLRNVIYKRENGIDKVIFNGEPLLLRSTSSGFQSSIPMAVFIEYFTSINEKIRFIIEEPELNLFPTAQNELVKYLVEKTRNDKNGLFIATHSPYTLTSLNNLMYAYQVGQKYPEEVTKEIEEKHWLNPDKVSAYMLKPDGYCDDIFDKEEGMIKAGMIDSVSSDINQKFEKILNIEFAKK